MSFPVGVDHIKHMFIHQPKHGFFYMDESQRMCFQRSNDLAKAPTEHLVHLWIECTCHIKLEHRYHFLISLEVNKRKKKLEIYEYFWVKEEA